MLNFVLPRLTPPEIPGLREKPPLQGKSHGFDPTNVTPPHPLPLKWARRNQIEADEGLLWATPFL